MPERARERNRSGFSIIEILVVCAALAMLAAILMPVFNTAKKTSYRTQCANNLRQFATAFSLYSHDWDGYWPCPGGLRGDWSYWAQTGSGGLQSYIGQRGIKSVWCCPLLPGWSGKYPARSYSMNSYLRTPSDVEYDDCLSILKGVRIDAITRLAKTVLLFEGIPLTNGWEDKLDYIYRCANWSRVRGYYDKIVNTIGPGEPWHGRLNNYLYCDGHVVARSPGRHVNYGNSLSTYSEMYQWYVDKAYFDRIPWSKKVPRN